MDALSAINQTAAGSGVDGARGAGSVEEMGSEDFLTLMVAQLKNQDPTKPMDNMQFMGQIAQFGTVAGIQDLQGGFAGLAGALRGNQTLQAAALVGRDVAAEGNVGLLRPAAGGEDGMRLAASVDLDGGATAAVLYVQDMTGALVHSEVLPPGRGMTTVQWDGTDADGNVMEAGAYRVSAEAMAGGESRALPVFAHHAVTSVAIAADGGVSLNLDDGRSIGVDAVKSFH